MAEQMAKAMDGLGRALGAYLAEVGAALARAGVVAAPGARAERGDPTGDGPLDG
jgi:hypothetical protein